MVPNSCSCAEPEQTGFLQETHSKDVWMGTFSPQPWYGEKEWNGHVGSQACYCLQLKVASVTHHTSLMWGLMSDKGICVMCGAPGHICVPLSIQLPSVLLEGGVVVHIPQRTRICGIHLCSLLSLHATESQGVCCCSGPCIYIKRRRKAKTESI